jgi:hypothetical protein
MHSIIRAVDVLCRVEIGLYSPDLGYRLQTQYEPRMIDSRLPLGSRSCRAYVQVSPRCPIRTLPSNLQQVNQDGLVLYLYVARH